MASATRSGEGTNVAEEAHEPTAETPASRQVDYLERNRRAWDGWAPGYLAAGRRAWADDILRWGIWGIPETKLGLVRGIDGASSDVVELGCGTADISAWLARQGARPVAVDIAPNQVRNVEQLQDEFDLRFPAACGNAEDVRFDDTSFDVAISEYGASLWCDPRRWLPEAHRLLRPNGRLIFVTNGAQLMVCTPQDGGQVGSRLVRDYFAPARVEFEAGGPVEFHPTHGQWVRLLVASGFVVEDLIEVRPPLGAQARFSLAPLEWARRWSSEEIWIARKAGRAVTAR
jgi:SAM-dependent methyltransferase